MPRFDPDTVAALAEGLLAPDRALALETAIAADPVAAAELAAQRSALAAVRSATAPLLDDRERTTLRASVAAALGFDEADAPVTAAVAPRRPPWTAISVAAAALLAIVAIAPITGLLSGNSESTTTAAALDVTSTTAVTLESASGDASVGGTQAPTETAGVAAGPEATVPEDMARIAADADIAARFIDEYYNTTATGTDPVVADDLTACVDEARTALDVTDFYVLEIQDADGADVVVLYTVGADGSVTALGYLPADCALVVTYP